LDLTEQYQDRKEDTGHALLIDVQTGKIVERIDQNTSAKEIDKLVQSNLSDKRAAMAE
jgi:hypothetical protein